MDEVRKLCPSDPGLRSVELFNRLMVLDDDFCDFARRCYAYLDRMRPGANVRFDRYNPLQQRWAVVVANAYLLEGEHWVDFRWDDDYLGVTRERVLPIWNSRGRKINY